MPANLLQEAQANKSAIIANRRSIHRNPELAFEEYETAAFIRKQLAELGIAYREIANTGTVAHIGSDGPCIALRADIDALPIHEESGVDFASLNDGKMHACGHDAHTSMLLEAARLLKRRERELPGVIKLIFQPGEEKLPGGASIMIKEGVLKDPSPLAIFGQHVNPAAVTGEVGLCSGAMMASCDELYWTVGGRSGHAAQPHLTIDPIYAAASIITQLQSVISRQCNPFDSGVLSVTAINGGFAANVIPDKVEMKGTLRAMNLDWRELALESIQRQSSLIAESMGATCELTILRGYPPLVNNEGLTELAATTAKKVVGDSNTASFLPKMWAEDFAYYAQEMPASFWMLGVRPPDVEEAPGLHNSKFYIDEDALPVGAAMLAGVALERLALC